MVDVGWLACKGTPPWTGPCNAALYTLVVKTSGKGVMEERGQEPANYIEERCRQLLVCQAHQQGGWTDNWIEHGFKSSQSSGKR